MDPNAPVSQPQPNQTSVAAASSWPGAFRVFKPSLRTVVFCLGLYLTFSLLSGFVQYIPELLGSFVDASLFVAILSIIGTIAAFVFSIAAMFVLLEASKSRSSDFMSATQVGVRRFLPTLGVYLLLGLSAIVTLLLLIVPFFLVMPRLLFAPYFVIDQDMGPVQAMKRSWAISQSHIGKVYGIIGVNILMVLLIFTIIGIPISIFLLFTYSAASVLLYRYLLDGNFTVPEKQTADTPYPTLPQQG